MNLIQTTAKLYECRDACKSLWGDDWLNVVQPYIQLINLAMIKHSTDNPLKASLIIIGEHDEQDNMDNSIFNMKLFAAVVTIIEGQ